MRKMIQKTLFIQAYSQQAFILKLLAWIQASL